MSKKKHTPSEWLDRALFVSPYFLTLCTTRKHYVEVLKHLELPKKVWPDFYITPQANATAHFFETGNGGRTAVVCMALQTDKTYPQIVALLVHEAVHIWQAARDDLGEKAPSSELEAYAIQSIAQRLLEEYERQTT